jgi:hypothetical protein
MGSKWTVMAYRHLDGTSRSYMWDELYRGESLWQAIRVARKAKKTAGAVKIEWR